MRGTAFGERTMTNLIRKYFYYFIIVIISYYMIVLDVAVAHQPYAFQKLWN